MMQIKELLPLIKVFTPIHIIIVYSTQIFNSNNHIKRTYKASKINSKMKVIDYYKCRFPKYPPLKQLIGK